MNLGEQYLQRINDGRKVWLRNQVIDHVAKHPVFAETTRTIADLLNKQTTPETCEELSYTNQDNTSRTNMAFLVPRSIEDLFRRHNAFKYYANATFGVTDGLSQYARSVLTGHYASRNFIGIGNHYSRKLEAYYKLVSENDLLCTIASHDPQENRSHLPSKLDGSDSRLRVVNETKEGIIVRGARMAAANAPYVDEILISFYDPRSREDQHHGSMFAVAAHTPGVHIVCRDSFVTKEIENHPLSGRYEDMDSVIIFDDVLVPWERVFIASDPEAIKKVQQDPVAAALAQHQSVVRLLSNLEFIAAVGHALTSASEVKTLLHVQEKMGELIIQLEAIKGLLLSAEHRSSPIYENIWLPDERTLHTARNLGARFYPRSIEILQQVGSDTLLQNPATLEEFNGPIGHLLRNYYRGADREALERTKLIKLAWDLVGSPLATRRKIQEQFFWGDPVQALAVQYENYPKESLTEAVWKLVETKSR
ncbi:4-hydroxyphenylacetate 3-hydroxylase N-terminal domain-containing protein [Cohnella terricola]|uniref:4-hydroxyphenylacetate 3-hydroxylase n=1 Tax=Cohnella terricola TaxID=1289167 RepID=A0A559J4Q3_9BACL|nr:4-hydroxyphenylacetate 3-hydroxylase N-terminal domain-containing protein [Cohnella terricola]TVX94796.1 4-hydroxyphenylacetate 3-hydroxylase [Cohnella terricola]